MSQQITLDFARPFPLADTGKKTERITFTGSSDLKEFINQFSTKQNTSISELIQRYVIEGLQRDIGNMLLLQANGQKSLHDLLKRY